MENKIIHVPFIIASKYTEYLGINLTKNMQDLYVETYKILLREIKGDLDKWRDMSYLQTGKCNTIKMLILFTVIHRASGIPTDKLTLKCTQPRTKAILKNKKVQGSVFNIKVTELHKLRQ